MGSSALGLSLPGSNLNIQLTLKSKDTTEEEKETSFREFAKKMARDRALVELHWLESRASFTLAKFRLTLAHGGTNVELIFRSTACHHNPKTEEVVRDLTSRYPVVKPVYFAVKSLLADSPMADPNAFGLTSFSLLLMIVAIVQDADVAAYKYALSRPSSDTCIPQPQAPSGPDTHPICHSLRALPSEARRVSDTPSFLPLPAISPGKLFIDFLYWYGIRFGYKEFAVRVSAKADFEGPVFPTKATTGLPPFCVYHPSNPTLVTTKAFKQIDELKQWCKLTLVSVFSHCFCRDLRGSGRTLGLPEGIPKPKAVEARVAHLTSSRRSIEGGVDETTETRSIQFRRAIDTPSVSVERTSQTGDSKLIRRKRLSNKSQTYEAKVDQYLPPPEVTGPNPGDGYTFRRMLISAQLK